MDMISDVDIFSLTISNMIIILKFVNANRHPKLSKSNVIKFSPGNRFMQTGSQLRFLLLAISTSSTYVKL